MDLALKSIRLKTHKTVLHFKLIQQKQERFMKKLFFIALFMFSSFAIASQDDCPSGQIWSETHQQCFPPVSEGVRG